MADDADAASDKEEVTLAAYIRAIRNRAMLSPTGYCWNCSETTGNRLFCSPECHGDYERRQMIKNRTRT